MARYTALRSLLRRHHVLSSTNKKSFSTSVIIIPSSESLFSPPQPFSATSAATATTNTVPSALFRHKSFPLLSRRTFCSSASSGPSNMVLLKSDSEFNTALKKVQDESLPAIFYFTATWCGPCRFIAPIINKWGDTYPHVTTYKIDIDEAGLANTLSKLNISSVPTIQFYHKGAKESEVIGADVAKLNATVEELYK